MQPAENGKVVQKVQKVERVGERVWKEKERGQYVVESQVWDWTEGLGLPDITVRRE